MQEVNLLVVDDDQEDCELISRILKNSDYSIFVAYSGEEALRLIESEEISIVLLDVRLPGLSGYEVCKEIRKTQPNTPIQIVLMSGLREDHYVDKIVELGADDFIRKDISVLELQARVKAAHIRLQNQTSLLKEKEFYQRAMAEEERLSSVVMDQNKSLKEAFDRIKKLNRKLEKANKELERIATYDSLSGLLNRRSMYNKIDVEIERALRLGVTLSGIMGDIDHFKNVNDNYGHKCGDEVIRGIGEMLRKGLRRYDDAGRYGGEEFFIILPNTSKSQAVGIAERFRREIEDLVFLCDERDIRVTMSMGVAHFNSDESREDWIMRADQAMYHAKQDGRNRVVEAD